MGGLNYEKESFFVILFLTLAIFLSGCSGGGIVTPVTDEAKIKNVVNELWLAINDQNWSKAKSIIYMDRMHIIKFVI